jgi:hypothetical protein
MKFYAETSDRMKKKEAEVTAKVDNRPWQDESLVVTADDILTNELEGLYNETVASMLPGAKRNCSACGKPVEGSSRVSDGELIWHPACAGSANVRRFTSEAVNALRS